MLRMIGRLQCWGLKAKAREMVSFSTFAPLAPRARSCVISFLDDDGFCIGFAFQWTREKAQAQAQGALATRRDSAKERRLAQFPPSLPVYCPDFRPSRTTRRVPAEVAILSLEAEDATLPFPVQTVPPQPSSDERARSPPFRSCSSPSIFSTVLNTPIQPPKRVP